MNKDLPLFRCSWLEVYFGLFGPCLTYHTSGYDADMMREVVNYSASKTEKYSAVFSGDDENGYSFVVASRCQDMNSFKNEMNSKLNARGGGRDGMIQGKAATTKTDIINFFQEV